MEMQRNGMDNIDVREPIGHWRRRIMYKLEVPKVLKSPANKCQ